MTITPLPHIASIPPYPPGRPISAVAREYGLDPAAIIKLASNENPRGTSILAQEAITLAAPESHLYPDFDCFDLYAALSEKLGLPENQIALGAGSSELILTAVRAFVGLGQKAVMPQYSFISYAGAVQSVGGKSVVVKNKGWQPDLDAMLAAVDEDVRIVFLTSPNNPTGILVPRAEMLRFASALPEHVLLVVDGAYHEYVDPALVPTTEELLSSRENILVLRTFSKIFGLSGLRVGYGFGCAELISFLRRMILPFSVNSMAQAAAVAVLSDTQFFTDSFTMNAEERTRLEKAFAEMGLDYVPSYGNFVLVKTGDGPGTAKKLMQKGMIVRPVANYGLPEWLRITVGLPEENTVFLKLLREVLH